MSSVIGREYEKAIMTEALHSADAELIAVYGRRRVGKTFLIREFYKNEIAFSFTGQYEADLDIQLTNFSIKLDEFQRSPSASIPPKNWNEAFVRLKSYLIPLLKKKKVVVFIDEFPWIDTSKSGFLSAFDYFWNDWASTMSKLKVVICGSAASWMIRKVIQNKGGLHNRVTRKIRLLPFTLSETELFLKNKHIQLDRYQIIQLYMALGGIPYYLKEVKKGQSVAQTINELCFTKAGLLQDEFNQLFRSLFQNYQMHEAIIRLLAQKNTGFTRKEIIEKTNISSGGTVSLVLEELSDAGFISAYIPYGKNHKNLIYKLSDEYSLFYLKFIDKNKYKGDDIWNQLCQLPTYKIWCGFSFESICQKHISNIKKHLGISGIYTETSVWRLKGNAQDAGTQIDLLIDRKDNCINVCEMKFTDNEYVIDKTYAQAIQHKINIFKEATRTKKTLFFTLISPYTCKDNEYKTRWIDKELGMNALFE